MAWAWPASPTCPPNGLGSTRCSDFLGPNRPFEPSLCLSRSPFPGNGISGPEKNAQKPPADCNDAVSENEPSHRSSLITGATNGIGLAAAEALAAPRREPRHLRSQQDQDAHCVGSHQGDGREE